MIYKNFKLFLNNYGKDKLSKIYFFIFLSIIAGCMEFIGIALIYPFILMIINPETVIHTQSYISVTNSLHLENESINTFLIGFGAILIFIIKNIYMMGTIYFQNQFIVGWKNDITSKFMKYYLYASYKDNMQTPASEKIYNLTILIGQVLDGYVLRTLNIIINTIVIGIILLLLLIKLPLTAIVTTVFLYFAMKFQNKFFKTKTNSISAELARTSVDNNNSIMECIKNYKEVKILGIENYFFKRFQINQEKYNQTMLENNYYTLIPPYIIETLIVITFILFAIIITLQNLADTTKILASYGLVVMAIFRIAPALNRIQSAFNQINTTKRLMEKLNEYAITYQFENQDLPDLEAQLPPLEYKKSLKLEGINFQYKENRPVIKNVNLEIKAGEFIGIIGDSGAGKTTLAEIIMGLLPADYGNITLDDIFINQRNFFSLRKIIGYVPQNINLIDGSFAKNVAWGIEDEDIDYKKVELALKKAQLWEYVETFEEKANAQVILGTNGLSQGQKQRLAIARALYRNPKILIFDEATSALDLKTEHEVTEMLKEFKGKKTIIAIAHRLSTLKMCDRIVYLKNGEIIDTGTFKELSALYKEIEYLIKMSNIKN
ncbi:ABC transporter ATP-binding protein [bacterium]|nr:ABC transporter ATP-binding protein [bacterium]